MYKRVYVYVCILSIMFYSTISMVTFSSILKENFSSIHTLINSMKKRGAKLHNTIKALSKMISQHNKDFENSMLKEQILFETLFLNFHAAEA